MKEVFFFKTTLFSFLVFFLSLLLGQGHRCGNLPMFLFPSIMPVSFFFIYSNTNKYYGISDDGNVSLKKRVLGFVSSPLRGVCAGARPIFTYISISSYSYISFSYFMIHDLFICCFFSSFLSLSDALFCFFCNILFGIAFVLFFFNHTCIT